MAKILSYYRHASAYHNNDDKGKGLYKKNNSLIQRQILYHNRADGWVGLNSLFITWQSTIYRDFNFNCQKTIHLL